ncbi:DUF3592 domain-containing protein [Arthrobacter sp. RCC_34]|uniref:DUF3592 domain-containing protein n=1 Tax=Arthrobacter sp. RCC_34 TaxID=3239230 RepID=UPI00352433C7
MAGNEPKGRTVTKGAGAGGVGARGAGARVKGWLSSAIFVAVLLIGPTFAVAGFVMVAQDEDLLAHGTRTPGIVVKVEDGRKASNRKIVASYSDDAGEPLTVRALIPTELHPAEGDPVTVVHEPGNPSHAVVEGYETWGIFFRGVGLFVTFLLLIPVMLVFLMKRIRRRRRLRRAKS